MGVQAPVKLTEAEKQDIQAYITSGFKHMNFATYLFLNITDKDKAKAWLNGIVDEISTAATWQKDSAGKKIKPETRLNIAFSKPGLGALGLPEEVLCTFSTEFYQGIVEKKRSKILGDIGESAPEKWEIGGPNSAEVHVFLALYGATESIRDEHVKNHHGRIDGSGGLTIIAAEDAQRFKANREHFGFHDGIGQPRIYGVVNEKYNSDSNVTATGEFILGYKDAYDFFPPSPVVPNDYDPHDVLPADTNPLHLNAYKDFGRNGCYVIYRKLEQEVAAFWKFMVENTKEIPENNKSVGENALWLASKCVGRWPSGVSLVASPDKDDLSIPDNKKDAFLYIDNDKYGLACPFGSHIRRSNPRDSIMPKPVDSSLLTASRHRIMRRGMTYGTPLFDHDILDDVENRDRLSKLLDIGDDGQARGFQFIPVVANIQRQFELIQSSWTNNLAFNGTFNNKDPLIGDNPGPDADINPDRQSYMFIPQKPKMIRTSPLPRFVTVKGGAYLFMPGIAALRYLAQPKL